MKNKIAIRFFAAGMFFLSAISGFGEEKTECDTVAFLENTRHPEGRECWVAMEGKAIHQKRDNSSVEAKIYLGMRFSPEATIAQFIVNGNESYYIKQIYASGNPAEIIPANKTGYDKSMLADIGIHPEDFAMTFLFYDLVKELERDSVKGYECRVLLLSSRDNAVSVKVFISSEYFFPLKAEWYNGVDTRLEAPFRIIEVKSFHKENGIWLAGDLLIHGTTWQTKIEFEESRAGLKDEKAPENLFRDVKLMDGSEKKNN